MGVVLWLLWDNAVTQALLSIVLFFLKPLYYFTVAGETVNASSPWFSLLYRCLLTLVVQRLYVSYAPIFYCLLVVLLISFLIFKLVLRLHYVHACARRVRGSCAYHMLRWAFRKLIANVSSCIDELLAIVVIIVSLIIWAFILSFFVFQLYQEVVSVWDHAKSYVEVNILQSKLFQVGDKDRKAERVCVLRERCM